MPDYQVSKIYQLVCLTTGQKYIGSTTQSTLALRLAGHRKAYNQWKKDNGNFVSSFAILEHNNYQIELLETFPCNSRDELNSREGHYIRTIDCVNKQLAGRTDKEWYETNRDDLLVKMKSYYQSNKTKIKERMKQQYYKKKQESLPKIISTE